MNNVLELQKLPFTMFAAPRSGAGGAALDSTVSDGCGDTVTCPTADTCDTCDCTATDYCTHGLSAASEGGCLPSGNCVTCTCP